MSATVVAPAEWEETAIGDIAAPGGDSMATGPFGSSIGSRFFRSSGVPIIRGGNLSTDPGVRLRDSDLVFLDPAKASEFTRSTVRDGDLIFTCWGTINQIGLIDETALYDLYVISNKQMKLTPDPSRVSSLFLYYLFSSPALQREILDGSIGSSIPGFNLARLRSMRVRLPGLAEQKRIAATLAEADEAVRALERLVQKRLDLLDATAVKLLAEAVQSADSENIRPVVLGDLLVALKGNALSKSRLSSYGSRRCLLYGELFTTYGRVIHSVVSRTDQLGGTPSRAGDVLMPGSTTTEAADLAVASALLEPGVAIGGDTVILRARRPNAYDPVFMAYYLTTCQVRQIASLAQGITIVHLYGRHLEGLRVELPSYEKQLDIARILQNMDEMVAVTKAQLIKAREIRHGLMQQLLSGLIVLPAEAAS